jgi:hypothetical protein
MDLYNVIFVSKVGFFLLIMPFKAQQILTTKKKVVEKLK